MPAEGDRHRIRNYPVRIEPDDKKRFQETLDAAGWTIRGFFLACVAMLLKRPKTFLAQLEPFRPAERRGRPRKS